MMDDCHSVMWLCYVWHWPVYLPPNTVYAQLIIVNATELCTVSTASQWSILIWNIKLN
jgi:hypothetical protein